MTSQLPTRTVKERLAASWASWPGRVLRLALAVLPFVWLSRSVAWGAVLASAVQIGPGGLLLALGALFAAVAVSAIRWRVLLVSYGADRARLPGTATLLRYYMIALYFAVLPTGMVGEAVRGLRLERCFEQRSTAWLLLVVERLAGLLGLLLLATLLLLWSPLSASSAMITGMGVAAGLALGLTLVLFAFPQLSRAHPGLRSRVRGVPLVGLLALIGGVLLLSEASDGDRADLPP